MPSNAQWQAAANGSPDPGGDDDANDCNTTNDGFPANDPVLTGSRINCVSARGAYDMVGNVWEWVGGTEDHMHLVVSIPPTLSVAECMKHIKGATARAVNVGAQSGFKWQEGYGALTIGGRSLGSVIDYVRNQKEHHSSGTTLEAYERMHDEGDLRS